MIPMDHCGKADPADFDFGEEPFREYVPELLKSFEVLKNVGAGL